MKRTLSLMLALLLLLLPVVCSCNGDTDNGGGEGGKDVIKTDDEYVIPQLDMEGETVTVLNVDEFYKMKVSFVAPEDSDDTLDVAIYESNKRLEEQFNFTLEEDQFDYVDLTVSHNEMGNHIVKNATSGDDVYDFIHYPVNQRMELITSGYIMDLSELEGLHLDKPWWDQQINANININGRQYIACGAINLMPYEAMTTVFFNKDILANNNLDDPYEMVREGTWTLDAMIAMAREAQNLGTDSQWNVLEGGTSVCGFAKHNFFPCHFLIGAGIRYVTETNGEYSFTLGGDDFYLAAEKIRELFTNAADGGVAGFKQNGGEYINYFSQGRALFLTSELKAGVEMRESEVNFGLLPTPKLRAEQEMYYTDATERLHYICVPTLSARPDDVAIILDAMAYDRYNKVIPVYYDSYVSYKGLRDEESVEMLEIMSAGRTVDVGYAYGWCTAFTQPTLNEAMMTDQLSSVVAANKDSIDDVITNFIENYLD